jgi:hypothetical protein
MAIPTGKKRKALERVARWLEAGAPHRDDNGVETHGFNMSFAVATGEYGHGVDLGNNCGTVCCIAGAVCQFQRIPFADFGGFFSANSGPGTVAQEYLGLSDSEARYLFMPFDYHESHGMDYTPAMGAATIRNFLHTGDVVWEYADGTVVKNGKGGYTASSTFD